MSLYRHNLNHAVNIYTLNLNIEYTISSNQNILQVRLVNILYNNKTNKLFDTSNS